MTCLHVGPKETGKIHSTSCNRILRMPKSAASNVGELQFGRETRREIRVLVLVLVLVLVTIVTDGWSGFDKAK